MAISREGTAHRVRCRVFAESSFLWFHIRDEEASVLCNGSETMSVGFRDNT